MPDYNRRSRSRDVLDRINDREHSTTLQDKHSSARLKVDTKRTEDIFKRRNNDILNLPINDHESHKQRRASVDFDSPLINSSDDVSAYDTLPLLSSNRISSGTQSRPRQLRSASSLDRIPLDRQPENPRPMPRRTPSPSK
jgi:hypothetical protein